MTPLTEADITSVDDLRMLTEDDLKEMSLTVGARRKLLKALSADTSRV